MWGMAWGGPWGEQSPQPHEGLICPCGVHMLSCGTRNCSAGNQLLVALVPVRPASDSLVTGMATGAFTPGLGRPGLCARGLFWDKVTGGG